MAHGSLAPLAPHDLAGAWTHDPGIIATLLVLGVPYAIGVRRLWAHAGPGRGVTHGAVLRYALGWLTLAVALASPLHALGEVLFSAHMAQHELLIAVAAPLLVLGQPGPAFAWALPRAWHRRAGALAAGAAREPWRRVRALARDPWATAAAHAVALWAWHVPRLYTLSLRSDVAHAAQHAAFLGTAWAFWRAVLSPRGRRRPAEGAAALFVTALHGGALGALVALAPRPWIAAYGATTGPWGLTPMEDQQLAGLLMWIPGGVTYLVAALWLMATALRETTGASWVTQGTSAGGQEHTPSRAPALRKPPFA